MICAFIAAGVVHGRQETRVWRRVAIDKTTRRRSEREQRRGRILGEIKRTEGSYSPKGTPPVLPPAKTKRKKWSGEIARVFTNIRNWLYCQ